MPVNARVMAEDLGRLRGLLVRGEREDVREARRVAASLQRALAPSRHPDDEERDQLALPLRMRPDAIVADCPLSCPPNALCCTARQIANDLQVGRGPAQKRSSRAKRGRVGKFVSCRTDLCPVGARVRLALGDVPDAVEMARRAPKASDTSEA
jgi:hypothetical protein